jgi:hypothetical protein
MRKTILVLVALALVCVPVVAQRTTATVRGTVVDSQGETVAGAKVTIVNVETGLSQEVVTTAAGTYNIPQLPVGTYVVTMEAEGFKSAIVQNVVLNVGDTRQIDGTLEVGAVTEAVTVTSSAVVVETIGGEVAGLITGEQVRELPLNGRNFIQLTQLMPGVSAMDNFNVKNKGLIGGSDISVAGSRATGNVWLVDGANNNDTGSNRTILIYPSLEAVEEFKVHRNSYGAEFGGAGGAQINLVTRGGTNNLRGSAYYFGRRGSWNETNFILEQANAEKDDLTVDNYGFTLGGAFIKDKLHFFASTEWNEEVRGIARTAQVPTALERQGDFSQSDFSCRPRPIDPQTGQPFPNDQIPLDRLSEAGQNMMNLYPLPNNTSSGCENWVDSINVPLDWNQINARLDWSVTDRARVMVRYTEDDWTNNSPTAGDANGLWGDDPFPNVDSNWAQPSDSLVAQINNVIGSSALNTFSFSMSGNEINIGQGGDSALQQAIRETNPPAFPAEDKLSYPNTAHPVFWGGGGLQALWQAGPWNNAMEHKILKNDYEQVFGQHVLKAGILYSDSSKEEPGLANASNEMPLYWGEGTGTLGWGGDTTGNVVANFLLDDIAFGYSEFSFNQEGPTEWNDLEIYVADSWKLRDNLTFDFGVRYTKFFWPESGTGDKYLNWNPQRWDPEIGGSPCNGLMQVPGTDPCGEAGFEGAIAGPNAALINDTDNFAPRLGLAWDVFRNGKSVLRAGFGQFFQRERVSPQLGFFNNPPAVAFGSGIRTLDGTFNILGVGTPGPQRGFDVNANTPFLYQYNLTWEQRVGRDSTVEVSYVGSQGRDLMRSSNPNSIPLNQDINNNGVNDRLDYVRCPAGDSGCQAQFLPYGVYGANAISFWQTDGSSDYDSIQAQYITRFGRGSQVQASYTFANFTADSSMIDSSGGLSAVGTVTDPFQSLDDGDADMAREHVFNASAIYNLPTFAGEGGVKEWLLGNWAIGGIIIYSSGTPITVFAPDPSGDLGGAHPGGVGPYEGNQRPLATGASCSGGGDTLQILNPAAYTLTGYQLGNASQQMARGTCEGPDFFQTDLSVYKNFPFRDRFNVQLRLEIFNLFDTTNIIGNNGVDTSFNAPVTLDAPRDQATVVTSTGEPASSFGRATRARDARQIQLGIKFSF